eukprot:3415034-Rhodomonas_salina.2
MQSLVAPPFSHEPFAMQLPGSDIASFAPRRVLQPGWVSDSHGVASPSSTPAPSPSDPCTDVK